MSNDHNESPLVEPAAASTQDRKEKVWTFGISQKDGRLIAMAVFVAVAMISGQEPTGITTADYLLTAAFMAILIWLSRWVSPAALMASAGLALLLSIFQQPALFSAMAAVFTGLYITIFRRLDSASWRIGAAITTGLSTISALSMPNIAGVNLTASLSAAIIIAPTVISALKEMPSVIRKWVWVGFVVLTTLCSTALLGAAYAGAKARTNVELAIDQAYSGIAQARSGQRTQAAQNLEASAANFDSAYEKLSGPFTAPARIIPVVSQHVEAISMAARQGSVLATSAQRALISADLEQILNQSGNLDLNQLKAINTELVSSRQALIASYNHLQHTHSPWLIPLLSKQITKVQGQLYDTHQELAVAELATGIAPGFLGAEGKRTYLVLFLQPAEAREFGGFVGAYGILNTDNGHISLAETGSFGSFAQHTAKLTGLERFPRSYLQQRPDVFPQNITGIADLTTIAHALRDLSPQWRDDPTFEIDAVITIDPYGLAAILDLVGPVTIEDHPVPIGSSNVVDFLLREQYVGADDHDERKEALYVLAEGAFERLLSTQLPAPNRIVEVFKPLAGSNRIAISSFDSAESELFARLSIDGSLPRLPEQANGELDLLGVFTATATPSKLDSYAERDVTYRVHLDPVSGKATGELTVTLANNVPASASNYVSGLNAHTLPAANGRPLGDRHNVISLSTYLMNQPLEITSPPKYRFDTEKTTESLFGYEYTSIVLEIPDHEPQVVTYRTETATKPGKYDLLVLSQATANPVDFTLEITVDDGWVIDQSGESTFTTSTVLNQHRGFSITVSPQN